METRPIPLLILGGRDLQASTVLPEAGREQHLLHGYKAMEVRIGGRSLIEVAIERFRDPGIFGPIWIAGPARVYQELSGVRVVDTDRSIGLNLKAGLEALQAAGPVSQVAITTGDILPDPAELGRALDDLRRYQPCDYWWAVHRVGSDTSRLGKSAWKPEYRMVPEGEGEPVEVLPGHLVVAGLEGLRLRPFYRVADLAYRTRNRSLAYRRMVLVRGTLLALLAEDLRRLRSARRPAVTWSVLYHGLCLAAQLKSGRGDQARMSEHLRRMWFDRGRRPGGAERRGRVAVLDVLSLAKDVDTEEEAREIAGGGG